MFDPDKAFAAAEAGGGMDAIAKRLGVGRRRLQKWMHCHPGFTEAIERGREADVRRPRPQPAYPVDVERAVGMRHQIDELIATVRALPPLPAKVAHPRDAEIAAALKQEVKKIAPQQHPDKQGELPDDRLGFAIALARQERPSEAAGAKPRITETRRPTAPEERNPVNDADHDPEDDPEWQRVNARHRLVRPKSWCATLDDPRKGW
ncbi:hypothetical protein [Mesorhizobium sp.]|uniref:hypothetical protein n=1 Tax=Mesorhizobium sp. TaxID=1871066 RepID=UPI0011F8D243|nr:hypothetical protein [Mesorhizobium sp.]TIQ46735.1 MAG: hypothetical protein E5X47_23360 [Mesorhizobium sp.]TIQ56508.1 MAG: hypothetical protein E5X46_18725 [Mesorhizobium sp.]